MACIVFLKLFVYNNNMNNILLIFPIIINNFASVGFSFYNNLHNCKFGPLLDTANSNENRTIPAFSVNSMQYYFSHLYDYSPVNVGGSCGFVSLIQTLSFYDCYLYDSLIPNAYEQHYQNCNNPTYLFDISSGVKRTPYTLGEPFSNNVYTYINTNKANDFQAKLMSIKDLYMIDHSVPNPALPNSIGMWDYEDLLEYYYGTDIVDFHERDYDFYGLEPYDTNVEVGISYYVKSKLDLGIPVILHVDQYDEQNNCLHNYHSVVAYYYDDDDIYCHFGWGTDSVFVGLKEPYNSWYIINAGYFSFVSSLTPMHSDNYILTNGNRYCGCGHLHNYSYSQYSSIYHTASCNSSGCTQNFLEGHTLVQTKNRFMLDAIDGTPQPYICSKCGYISLMPKP